MMAMTEGPIVSFCKKKYSELAHSDCILCLIKEVASLILQARDNYQRNLHGTEDGSMMHSRSAHVVHSLRICTTLH